MIDKIICGDSIELIKSIDNEYVHAIISDIPYGICYEDWDILHNNSNSALGGTSNAQLEMGSLFKRRGKPLNGWSESDKKIPLEYQEWCSKWASDWLRVLKSGGSCFIFAGRRYAHRCIVALEDAGFTFKDMLAWEKNFAAAKAQRLSSIYERRNDDENEQKWKGWRVANLRPIFEPILWFQKPYKIGGTIADNVINNEVGAWNEEAIKKYNLNYRNNNFYDNIIKVETSKSDFGNHVNQKPLKLMEFLISLVTKENAIILDPFCGSGTTCIAAKNINRHYIGIEIDSYNVEISNKRLLESMQLDLNIY
ncbi:DNA-methyltransferase [Brachyspira aalborgi]|jgi:site-specific DNA-methyltransferase (adenine-specific)|uniref:Methyltransferase n=5 Tax=Brachyspira TaxID=29521 RepID=A0ABY3KAB9_9SPIR|nr:site-specific DNA-methyltransferase [Brachyspira aalborgi]TXJ32995.1 site-specific DNA-methyltransferase [Brachyspira aalborgi]TXJ41621.1 site-specific DNA-methyltransferase [Brachyspira aalborgi]CCY75303.1 dNA methylase [Brachyspira sp. CAG:700]